MKARAERLADSVAEFDVDLVLITDVTNVRYLTGYTGSNGLALVGPLTRTFLTDFRYVIQSAAHQLTGLNLCALGDSIEPFLASVITRYEDQFRAYVPRAAVAS